MATINEIKQQAAAVKNATQVGENTAERVGCALAGLADIAEQHDSKLSDLSCNTNSLALNALGEIIQDISIVNYQQNHYFNLFLPKGTYTYIGLGDASGSVKILLDDTTSVILNNGSGIGANIPKSFTIDKPSRQLVFYCSSTLNNYGFMIKKENSLKDTVSDNSSRLNDAENTISNHDILINTKIVDEYTFPIIETLDNVALNKGTLFTESGLCASIAKVKAGTTLYLYKDGILTSCRYGLYKDKPRSGSTTSLYSNSANTLTVPSDKDYYIAISDNTKPTKSFEVKSKNSNSIIGNVDRLVNEVFSKEGSLDVKTTTGKYLDHNNGYIGNGEGWTIGQANVKAGSIVKFYADGILTSCRYALFNNNTNIASFSGISGGGSKEITIPEDKDYILVICLHSVVEKFSIESIHKGLDQKVVALEDKLTENATRHKILWLGTSIPCYSHYPEKVCELLHHKCYNMAIGSSGIIVRDGVEQGDRNGKDLCESSAEKESRYRSAVESGKITEDQLNTYKTYGYDSRVIPYIDGTIDSCDVVVIDHGYNDRDTTKMQEYIDKFDTLDLSIDGDTYDRTDFIGAFRFLLHIIFATNPKVKVLICSYLENKTCGPEFPKPNWNNNVIYNSGYQICTLLKKLAEHYNFPYLNMCDYNGFSMEYLPNTSNYLASINSNYTVKQYTEKENVNNNITRFQYYCPDGIHPHTDTSGRSVDIIVSSLVHLMRDI